MISDIKWVSELIEIAGGHDAFPDRAGRDRTIGRVATFAEVIAAAADIVLASWSSKKTQPEKMAARPGWDAIRAVLIPRLEGVSA